MGWPKHEMELVTWEDYIWVSSMPTVLFDFDAGLYIVDGVIMGNNILGYLAATFYSNYKPEKEEK